MNTQLYCPNEERKRLITAEGLSNAIDYLEVLDADAPAGTPPQRTLLVHCLLPLTPPGLDRSNVVVEGGVRVTSVGVDWAFPADSFPPAVPGDPFAAERAYVDALPNKERVLVVRTDAAGDLSEYTLRLVASAADVTTPPPGFDVLLSSVGFSFKVECPSDFDCKPVDDCPEPVAAEPHIDYLAKDYASFRRLMLDRLAILMPDWAERNPADVQIALVELLAYRGDYLSYFQDAVAAESYLGTARRRVSLRRHARLVDYFVHDGMNARTWIAVTADAGGGADGAPLPAGTPLLPRRAGAPGVAPALTPEDLAGSPAVFETLHSIELRSERNELTVYTWRDPHCCLPAGATEATLTGNVVDLRLRAGDVLVFEEVLGSTGLEVDADPEHRHAVRLVADPEPLTDATPAGTVDLAGIRWDPEDALPFALDVSELDTPDGPRPPTVVRGNVVLADHGLSQQEPLDRHVFAGDKVRATLDRPELTHWTPYDSLDARSQPATSALYRDVRSARPRVRLEDDDGLRWDPQRDLLASGPFGNEFVVEMEDDRRAQIRFGEGIHGRLPRSDATFTAFYRTGNGTRGNVGADSLTRVVTDLTGLSVRNPLPAQGGTDAETAEQVRLYAPQAFRRQERAVTPEDYAEVAERHPQVQRAVATRRWTGSWHTMFVTVDRIGGRAVDAEFETQLRLFLERYRMAGYDLEVDGPRFVPLEIVMTVCVERDHIRSNVQQSLLDVFSNRDAGGVRGFFHPDNFTFGQPVYLSRVVATAMAVPGVEWVDVSDTPPNAFQRWGEPARGEVQDGMITMDRLEVARLDNDPNAPENGRLGFVMKGGL